MKKDFGTKTSNVEKDFGTKTSNLEKDFAIKTIDMENDIDKKRMGENNISEMTLTKTGNQKEMRKDIVALGLCVLSALLVLIGICDNEIAVVFRKAVNICMECIGIG